MSNAPQSFPLVAHIYFWLSFTFLGLPPFFFLYLVSDWFRVSAGIWITLLTWPGLVATLFWYGSRKCSSEKMLFRDGMLWISWSMITGWSTLSFCTVPPALLCAFLGAIMIALYGDLSRRPEYAPAKWSQLVAFFYRNRMRR